MAKIEYLNLYRPRKVILTKTLISRTEFIELLDIAERYIGDLRATRKNQKYLDECIKIIKEMKFVACFNPQFRQETYSELMEFVDDLYVEINV
jgi:hypothetical protein